jgi:hypothetical protein
MWLTGLMTVQRIVHVVLARRSSSINRDFEFGFAGSEKWYEQSPKDNALPAVARTKPRVSNLILSPEQI